MTDHSPAASRQLQILLAVHDVAGAKTATSVDVAEVHTLLGGETVMDRGSLEDDLSLLMKRGLLDGFQSLGGLNQVFLVPAGKTVAQEFRVARANPVQRMRQLQDDYLRWLYSEIEVHDRGPTPSDFLATSPHFHGAPYTAAEVEKAGERLAQGAFISGQAAWQYAGPLRPRLSAKGRYVVESDRSVHDVVSSTPSVQNNITTNVQGNANVANASPGATQTILVADWGHKVTESLDALTEALVALPADVRTVIEPLIADARVGVADNEPSRTRRALQAVGGFLTDSGSGALGGVLGTQVLALLPLLGG